MPNISRHFSILFVWLAVLSIFSFPQTLPAAASSPASDLSYGSNYGAPKSTEPHFSTAEKAYLQNKKQITMCVDPDWMPLEKIDKGVHVGMAADYMALFQQKISLPIILVPTTNWLESIQYAKARKCDIFSLAMPTSERKKYMNFTKPYLEIPLVMAARMNMPFVDDLSSLRGFKIGIVNGYAFGEILRKRFPQMDINDVPSIDKGLQMVDKGKLDGFIGTLATVGYSIQQNFPNELKVAGKFDEHWQLAIATRNDEPLLLSIFNKAISSLTTNQKQDILNRWMAVKFVKGKDYTTLWSVLMVVALGLAFILWRYYALRKYNLKLREQNKLIQAGENRYRKMFNAPNEAIFILEADTGKIIDVNQGMLAMFGYTYEEALQINVGSISSGKPPFTQDEAVIKIHKAVQKGSQSFEWHARKNDGTLFWIETTLKYTEFGGEHFVIAVVRNISERKEAEINLAAQNERLAVTLRSIGDGVITTDISGNIVLLNKVSEELTGWSNKEAVGRPLTEVFNIINAETREVCENPVIKVINSAQIDGLDNHTVLVAKDGTERDIADSSAPIMDTESNVIGVVLVFRDVTEQLKNEKELLRVKKLESVGVLAGGIAHDFNNILTAILGNINLVLADNALPKSSRKILMEAEKASIRARDLTQQLLTFSKGGAPVKETAALDTIIRDSANFVLHGSKVACRFDIPDNLLLVDIDKGQISQVIQNIVMNASHAMSTGGNVMINCQNVLAAKIPFDSVPAEEMFVKISIQDEGIGMTAKVIEKIFDPYFSTKQTGSGLGLAITHSIIIKHGGYILAESQPEVGTTFTIYLPAAEPGEVDRQEAAELRKSPVKAKILLMDDEEMVRSVAQAMLTKLGHAVELSEDGADAVKLYKAAVEDNNIFDIVIMDLTIPGGMGGKEAAQEILALNADAKIIVSSGYSNDPVMANFADFGFCAAIVKPYQLQELSKSITRII